MSTHRITIELSDECYQLLRQAIETGEYSSESEAVGSLLAESQLAGAGEEPAFAQWLNPVVVPA